MIPGVIAGAGHSGKGGESRIVVVGSYNLDTAIELDAFPVPGETMLALGTRRSHGGKGSNQAVQATRCGGAVSLIASVGKDPAGDAALDFWRMEGVAASGPPASASLPTGSATILVDRTGENIVLVNPGANHGLAVEDVVRLLEVPGAAPSILVTQLEIPLDVVHAAFRWSREAHVTTVLNAAPLTAPLPAALIGLTDILIVNEVEALALSGALAESDAMIASRRLSSQVGLAVILTRGAQGAALFRNGADPVLVECRPIDVRDTTGAGDAFIGAFVGHLAASRDIEQAVAWGVAAGCFACGGHGAVSSYGTRAEILARYGDLP